MLRELAFISECDIALHILRQSFLTLYIKFYNFSP